MAAETAASIAKIRSDPGSETPAPCGTLRQRRRERSCNPTPSAAPWANNGSTTSIRLAAGFRTPQVALPILALAAEPTLPEAATGDLSFLSVFTEPTGDN